MERRSNWTPRSAQLVRSNEFEDYRDSSCEAMQRTDGVFLSFGEVRGNRSSRGHGKRCLKALKDMKNTGIPRRSGAWTVRSLVIRGPRVSSVKVPFACAKVAVLTVEPR